MGPFSQSVHFQKYHNDISPLEFLMQGAHQFSPHFSPPLLGNYIERQNMRARLLLQTPGDKSYDAVARGGNSGD
jgi:hypothetical protein